MVGPGDVAPAFELPGVEDGRIREYTLDELTADSALVIGFYTYDFAPTCTKLICDIVEYTWLLLNEDVTVVGISGDGPYANMAFADAEHIPFPLLCDIDRAVCDRYDVLYEWKDGSPRVPRRSVFLVTPDQRVAFKWVADADDGWNGEPLFDLQDRIRELGFD